MPESKNKHSQQLNAKQKAYLILASVVVSVAAALTYYFFEAAVRNSINYIWDDLLNTDTRRVLVVPVCVIISLVYFGLQHYFDKKSENHEAHGLGESPTPSVINFVKVIVIGFFSLVAGASLGPEAILVPACLIIGGYAGVKLFNSDKQAVGLLTMVGFVALFAAFFDSFVAGLLALLIIKSQSKLKLTAPIVVFAAVASAVTIGVLNILESSAYTKLPPHSWHFSLSAALVSLVLLVCGYAVTYLLSVSHNIFEQIRKYLSKRAWWIHSLVAASGLSALYLLGGSLIQFTGNTSIVPMLEQSASLGIVGLLWIFITKVLAIGWCKTIGYRGGMIFPSIFVASVLVAMAQSIVSDVNFTIGLIAVMVGLLAANSKLKILF